MQNIVDINNLPMLPNLDSRVPNWQPFPIQQRSCPFCNHEAPPLFFRPDKLPIAQCRVCKCFFVALKLSEEALSKLYDSYWDVTCPRSLTDEMAKYLLYTAGVRYAKDYHMNKLSSLLGSWESMKVLDVGCGFGEKSSIMNKLGASVTGIDIASSAVNFCNSKLFIDTKCTTIDGYDISNDYFDLIVMFEFVEHPLDPLRALRIAVDKTKPGGFVAIATPNGTAGERWLPDTAREWIGFRVDLEHMQYLHVDTIDYLAKRLDCRIVHLEQLGFRSLDDIDAPPKKSSNAISASLRRMIKAIPGMRNAIYNFRQSMNTITSLRRKPVNNGDYHLFAVLQKR